jgi:hypothetical protein
MAVPFFRLGDPIRFNPVGRADFTALQPSESRIDIGNPEQDPRRRTLGGRQPSCAYKTQEPGRADNLTDRVLRE